MGFAIVVWEILTRKKPWHGLGFNKIMLNVGTGKQPLYDKDACAKLYGGNILEVMKLCWAQDPDNRPTFTEAVKLFSKRPKEEEISKKQEEESGRKVQKEKEIAKKQEEERKNLEV